MALPALEKERVMKQIEDATAEQRLARSRPLSTKERRQWQRFKSKRGRPKVDKGAKTISLTVERKLLEQADAYAKQQGISHAKLVAQGLQAIMGSAP